MITLGIECSSRQGSVALLKDGELLADKSWIADRVRHNIIFQTLEELVAEAGITYGEISLFAVGRGPGSFSGMRMSFAVAQALALPGKVEVRAVSSGAALALAVGRGGTESIAVVGDARRGQAWIGIFNCLNGGVQASKDWELVLYEEVTVPEGTLVVSPEAERMDKIFPMIGEPQFPHAKEVAELALMQSESEPLEPLYMHPPVFIEPKYS
jgi:tRNA threonylcarbamoyladenosine biosynthesis protein TsaB